MTWLGYALISAVSAAATAILAKRGVEGIPSTLATALRTVVVLVFAWLLVWQSGQWRSLTTISRRSAFFLALSGLATGISWLASFRALQLAPASQVAPIDKLSLPLTMVLAVLLLGETISWATALGVSLMTVGALLTVR